METTFAAALQTRRQAEGLSLRELSALVRYSAGWLSRVARGQGTPTLALARACDEALGAGGVLVARAELTGGARPEQLPAPVSAFVGRAGTLADLDAELARARAEGAALTVAVDGPPGVGKSAVALHWAHRVAAQFPEGVLYADLRGHSPRGPAADPNAVLDAFLRALGQGTPPDSVEARAALFRTAVAQRPGPVLVVLDNAVDTAQIRHLLPGAAGCAVVVTSRRRLTGLSMTTGARRVSLAPLSCRESLDLLRAVLGHARVEAERPAARAVVRHCGRLPLALRVTAERLASHPHRPLSHAVEEWEDGGLDVLADHDDAGLSVRGSFDRSYDELDPEVARTFRLLGLMPVAPVGTAAVAALTGTPLARTRRHLDDLVARHLLEETGVHRYEIHDLLRAYARERAAAEETAGERHACAARLTSWYLHGADPAGAPAGCPGADGGGAG
ncbi:helix-turn-helix domain-containing protein [Streptomyces liangshanensis]|uniref:Helix-turn-helix domain-containing protein n=1 Tax=Streptomyces liangshanensis TaxID=2717324 RepID=A0A6G9H4A4_9ACTN|nr:helix-turn-helix domain-containing protein [Streptomyces liangshanensis]QIQ04947.1 helix-turn-helix domain-containing protein [Streptomyces liangshanensis]